MMKKTPSAYAQKLKDPRWQKKRLEIFQRDEFMCRFCGDKDSTLHVHHKFYTWGKDPWDYDNSTFLTLCEACHESETAHRKEADHKLLQTLRDLNFSACEVDSLRMLFQYEFRNVHFINEVAICALRFAMDDNLGDKYFHYLETASNQLTPPLILPPRNPEEVKK